MTEQTDDNNFNLLSYFYVIDDLQGRPPDIHMVPTDIAASKDDPPIQPRLPAYPRRCTSGPAAKITHYRCTMVYMAIIIRFAIIYRSFQSSWLDRFSWMEYAVSTDKVYCFPCRFFGLPAKKITLHLWVFVIGNMLLVSLIYIHACYIHASFLCNIGKTSRGNESGVLTTHDSCAAHRGAMAAWSAYNQKPQDLYCNNYQVATSTLFH